MMSNPMVGQLMQRIQSDPELMQLISQPGIMAKLQQLMANPATAQQAMQDDPELQAVVQRLMGAGGGGGGGMGDMGGMGGGMGGGGMGGYGAPNPWGTPTPSSSSSSPPSTSSSTPAYISIHSDSQYHSALTSAGSRLVVVDFTASWCGPCRRIAPAFDELAQAYRGRVVFLKVDGDENRALCQELGVSSYPTFVFLVQGVQVERFSGADERKLRATVAEYGDKEEVRVCPYKHFPLKEAEAVKYADMKWDVVEAKVDEFNGKVGEGAGRLDAMEKAELDVVIQKLQNKINYQQATFSDAQFKVAEKVSAWGGAAVARVRGGVASCVQQQLMWGGCGCVMVLCVVLCAAHVVAGGVSWSGAESHAAVRAAPARGAGVQQADRGGEETDRR